MMINKEKNLVVDIFETFVKQIIKEVGDGILDLEPNSSYVKRTCMSFTLDLNRLIK